MMRVGILTVSDRVFRGEADDLSGPLVAQWCKANSHSIAFEGVRPDGTSALVPVLLEWADSGEVDLLITTGGTGFSPRDQTPEATRAVLERPAPGVGEALRRMGEDSTPFAVVGRGEVGVRGSCVLVNLPGSPGGVRDGLTFLDRFASHLVALARGENPPHPKGTS